MLVQLEDFAMYTKTLVGRMVNAMTKETLPQMDQHKRQPDSHNQQLQGRQTFKIGWSSRRSSVTFQGHA